MNTSSSGLAFFSAAGFGSPISIGAYNERTFISDSSGITVGAECDNIKFNTITGCMIGQSGSGLSLSSIPNYQATLNIKANFDTPVRTLNWRVAAYDGVAPLAPNPAPGATGVTTYLYECSHLSTVQSAIGSGGPGTPVVSGAQAWYVFPAGVTTSGMPLTASPGLSGMRPSGSSTVSNQHDVYLAISLTPTAVGSKSWALSTNLDYL